MKLLLLLWAIPALAQPPQAVLERIENSFSPANQVTELSGGYSFSGCSLTKLSIMALDPVNKATSVIRARVYGPQKASGRAIIVVPPTGGENILDRAYANEFCKAGFKTVLLQGWTTPDEERLDFAVHDEGALRSLAAVRHILDYLKPSSNSQVGILGASVGALTSALATGFDARLSTAVLVAGGINVAEIYASSKEQGATALREARMREFGLNQEMYLAALKENITIEPGDFIGHSGKKNILAFVGLKDDVVATKNQEELVSRWQARRVAYKKDHFHTILSTSLHQRRRITAFFDEHLAFAVP